MSGNARRLDPQRALVWVRRATLLGCALGGVYLWNRFESFELPADRCSPLVRLAPGTRLWIDLRPRRYGVRDVAFYLGPEGAVHFGEVERVEGSGADARYWIVVDDEACPVPDSRRFGWIEAQRMQGRLVFATAW